MASLLHCHQATVQRLLSEAITVLCQNSLPFRDQLCVQGILGITLDNRDVLLIDIHERVARSSGGDSVWSERTPSAGQTENSGSLQNQLESSLQSSLQSSLHSSTQSGLRSSVHTNSLPNTSVHGPLSNSLGGNVNASSYNAVQNSVASKHRQSEDLSLNVASRNAHQLFASNQHQIAACLQQQQQQQDASSIAFLSKMYERQLLGSRGKMETFGPHNNINNNNNNHHHSNHHHKGAAPASSSCLPPSSESTKFQTTSADRLHQPTMTAPSRMDLEAEEKEEGPRTGRHDIHHSNSKDGRPEDSRRQDNGGQSLQRHHQQQETDQSEGSISDKLRQTSLVNGHAGRDPTPPTDHPLKPVPSPHADPKQSDPSDPSQPTTISTSDSQGSSLKPTSAADGSTSQPPTPPGGQFERESPKEEEGDNPIPENPRNSEKMSPHLDRSPPADHLPPISPQAASPSPTKSEGSDRPQSAKEDPTTRNQSDSPNSTQGAGDQSISLTVSKIFSHRYESQPPFKKRLTEIAEQQIKEEQLRERESSELDDLEEAVNYTVCHSVKGKLRGSQKRKARASYPLDLSKVSQYEGEDREDDLEEWGVTSEKDLSESEDRPHLSSSVSPDILRNHQVSPAVSDAGNMHQVAAAYDDHQIQSQQQHQMNHSQHQAQRMQVKSSSSNSSDDLNRPNGLNSISSTLSNQPSSPLQHNSMPFGSNAVGQRASHLLPHHLPVNMFDGPLSAGGGDMGLSLMINNLVNVYGPGLPLAAGFGQKPPDLSPVGYHTGSNKPPNLNLGSMSLGSGSPQHSPHLLSPSPAHLGSPHQTPGTPTNPDERGHKCSQCGKLVASLQGLMIHYRTHTGEKPHVCGMCGKGLSTVQGLQVHQRTHTGEKPYICTTCGKGFNDKSNMKRHIRHCTLRTPTRFLLSNPLHHMSHS